MSEQDDALREMAANRGCKLVKSRRRKPGGDFGRYGLKDAKSGNEVLGFGVTAGFSSDGLVELIELPGHPWFMACQYHPEFNSTPRDGHPLFTGFIRAARNYRAASLPHAASA